MSKINVTNLGRPNLPTGSVMVSNPPGPEVTMGNNFGAGVSSLPNGDQNLLEKEEWNELFGNSRELTNLEEFSSDESDEMEDENTSENTTVRWTKGGQQNGYEMFLPKEDLERNRCI